MHKYKNRQGILPPARNEATGEFKVEFLGNARLPAMMKEAIDNPGERINYFFHENGYEYEHWVIYDQDKNVLIARGFCCPHSAHHHVGSICKVCGLNDTRIKPLRKR